MIVINETKNLTLNSSNSNKNKSSQDSSVRKIGCAKINNYCNNGQCNGVNGLC